MAERPLLVAWQRATHRLVAVLDMELSELRLSAGEVNALACFGDRATVSVRELVEASGQRPSTLTGILDRLERRRFAVRVPDPADRRSVQVELTTDGRRAAAAVAAAFAAVERRLSSPDRVADAMAAVDAALQADDRRGH